MSLRYKSIDCVPQWRGPATPATPPAKPRKYRNQPVVEDGQRFDSKLEARCYQWLRMRTIAGEVRWVIRQVPFRLEGGVIYRADFLAMLMAGGSEVIDAKGMLTRSTANKLKQVKARYGIDVVLWKG
jgi:hypothetical protein